MDYNDRMHAESRRIVLCAGTRTPIGHISRSLADLPPAALMHAAVHTLLDHARLEAAAVDGLIVGWVGQTFSAPNIARVVALTSGLPILRQMASARGASPSPVAHYGGDVHRGVSAHGGPVIAHSAIRGGWGFQRRVVGLRHEVAYQAICDAS